MSDVFSHKHVYRGIIVLSILIIVTGVSKTFRVVK